MNKHSVLYSYVQCVTGGGEGGEGPPSTFTGKFFKEKPTFRVWCLYRYLVHAFILILILTSLDDDYDVFFFIKIIMIICR